MFFSIWVDADSCPVLVRNLIIKFSLRLNMNTFFVANRIIPFSINSSKSSLVRMIVTNTDDGAADDYIVNNANKNDIVITRDIPLAARLLERNITVINDRGKKFSLNTINEQLSIRNFNYNLALNGINPSKNKTFDKTDLNNFANCFDKEIQAKLNQRKQ